MGLLQYNEELTKFQRVGLDHVIGSDATPNPDMIKLILYAVKDEKQLHVLTVGTMPDSSMWDDLNFAISLKREAVDQDQQKKG